MLKERLDVPPEGPWGPPRPWSHCSWQCWSSGVVSESLQGPHHCGVVCKDCSLLVLGWEGSLKLQRTWRPGPRGLQYNSDHTGAGLLRGLEELSSSWNISKHKLISSIYVHEGEVLPTSKARTSDQRGFATIFISLTFFFFIKHFTSFQTCGLSHYHHCLAFAGLLLFVLNLALPIWHYCDRIGSKAQLQQPEHRALQLWPASLPHNSWSLFFTFLETTVVLFLEVQLLA